MLLDYFALAVLLVLATAAVVIWVLLGIMPGRIARDRNHPHADAISVCGWWGVLTMGLLLPVAYIWAYSNPRWRDESRSDGNSMEKDNTT
jgi:ABC-type Fe3+ transport system permease subunit